MILPWKDQVAVKLSVVSIRNKGSLLRPFLEFDHERRMHGCIGEHTSGNSIIGFSSHPFRRFEREVFDAHGQSCPAM
jgi:hypothetical protein